MADYFPDVSNADMAALLRLAADSPEDAFPDGRTTDPLQVRELADQIESGRFDGPAEILEGLHARALELRQLTGGLDPTALLQRQAHRVGGLAPASATSRSMAHTITILKKPEIAGYVSVDVATDQGKVKGHAWLLNFSGILIVIRHLGDDLTRTSYDLIDPAQGEKIRELIPPIAQTGGQVKTPDELVMLEEVINESRAGGEKYNGTLLGDIFTSRFVIGGSSGGTNVPQILRQFDITMLDAQDDLAAIGYHAGAIPRTTIEHRAGTGGIPFSALNKSRKDRGVDSPPERRFGDVLDKLGPLSDAEKVFLWGPVALKEKPVADDPFAFPLLDVPESDHRTELELNRAPVNLTNPLLSCTVVIPSIQTEYRLIMFGDFLFILGVGHPRKIFFHQVDKTKLEKSWDVYFQMRSDHERILSVDEEKDFQAWLADVTLKGDEANVRLIPPHTFEITEKGVRFQVDLGWFHESGLWSAVKLILPEGLDAARSLGIHFERKEPITQVQGGVIIAEKVHRKKKIFLVELGGILLLTYDDLEAPGAKEGIYAIPPALASRAKKIFQLGDEAFMREFLNLQDAIIKSPGHIGTYLSIDNRRHEIHDDEGNYRLVMPVWLSGMSQEARIGAWRLEVYTESDRLKLWGYKPEQNILYRSYRFEPLNGGTYKVGPFEVEYDREGEMLRFYNSPQPPLSLRGGEGEGRILFTLHRQGRKFVSPPHPGPLPQGEREIYVEGSFLPDPLVGAHLRLPLTPEVKKLTGIPHEEIYPLVLKGKSTGGPAWLQIKAYEAGPLGVIDFQTEDGRSLFFFVGSKRQLLSLDLKHIRELATIPPGDTGPRVIGLYPSLTKPGLFLPSSELGPVEAEKTLKSMVNVLSDLFELNFRTDRKFDLRGIVIRKSRDGGVLIVSRTDTLNRMLFDREKNEGATEVQKFQILAPPETAVAELRASVGTFEGPIRVGLNTGFVSYPVGTRFSLTVIPASSEGVKPGSSFGDREQGGDGKIGVVPDTGSRLQEVTRGRDDSTEDITLSRDDSSGQDDYQIELPVAEITQLREGQKITVVANGYTQEYRLQKKKGAGFSLMVGEENVGELSMVRDKLVIRLGTQFVIEGEIPKREVVESLTISGSGGPRELAEFLDRMAHRLENGYADSLRKIAALLTLHDNFSFAAGVEQILSVYQAEVTLEFLPLRKGEQEGVDPVETRDLPSLTLPYKGREWQFIITRRDDTPIEVFEDFVEAVGEIQDVGAIPRDRPTIEGEHMGSPLQGDIDFHPYGPTREVSFTLPDGTSVHGKIRSRFQDAVIDELEYRWPMSSPPRAEAVSGDPVTGDSVVDPGLGEYSLGTGMTVEWGGVVDDDGKSVWVEAGKVTLKFEGLITASTQGERGVELKRDLFVKLSREKIEEAIWIEKRTYLLANGDKLHLTFHSQAQSATMGIDSAVIESHGTHRKLTFSAAEFKWGDPIALKWEGKTTGGFLKISLSLVINQVPSKTDLSAEKSSIVSLSLPHTDGQTLRIVFDPGADSRPHVLAMELVSKRGITLLREKVGAINEGYNTDFTVETPHPLFGSLKIPITLFYENGQFDVRSPLVINSGPHGLFWAGIPNKEGLELQKIIYMAGDQPIRTIPPEVLKTGEQHIIIFRIGDRESEFIVNWNGENLLANPLSIPLLPLGFEPLDEKEITLPPRLFTTAVDLRPGEAEGQPLPFDIDKVRRHYTTDLTEALATMGENEVFYPTMETMNKMMRVVRATGRSPLPQSDRTIHLQFVSASSKLTFEQTFIYDPDSADKWRPANDNPSFNGQSRPAIHQKINAVTHQWVPIPPGTTRLFSVLLAGEAGFFCLINATGTTPMQLARRRQKAIEGFQRYLYAHSAGLLEKVDSRFRANPLWSIDATGKARCRLGLETLDERDQPKGTSWLSFTGKLNREHSAIFFEKGRTEITIGNSPGHGEPARGERSRTIEPFHGFFQGIFEPGSNRVLFVQLGIPEGYKRRVFSATFLPGADPLFVEIPFDKLFEKQSPNGWLFSEGWVTPMAAKPAATSTETGERHRKKYVLALSGSLPAGRPVYIQGNLPSAGADLLPYLINEQDWAKIKTVRQGEITEAHVNLMEEWLARGGSDFQLLPESVIEYRRAQKELAKIPRQEWRQKIPTMNPLHLWLANANGVRLQITLVAHVPPKGVLSKPAWVFHPDGTRNQGVEVRFVGKDDKTENLIQIYTPVTYDRRGSEQQIRIFDPVGLSGILQTLKMVPFEDLFALYDTTQREKPDDESKIDVLKWASPQKRYRVALARLIRLQGLVEEAEEIFTSAPPPSMGGGEGAGDPGATLSPTLPHQGGGKIHDEPELVEVDGQYLYLWTLREFEQDGNGGFTGKYIRIAYPLPHTTEPGSERWSRIPVPIGKKIKVQFKNDLFSDGWQEMEMDVYKTRDESLLLVDPANPFHRYVLSFDTTAGREGWPVIRQIRGFESGLDDFYSPPQWTLIYHVERVVSRKETQGLGRVLDVTSEYREAQLIPAGHHVYRYFFEVVEIQAACEIDLLIDPQGRIIRAFENSWQIEGIKKPLNRGWIKTEVVHSPPSPSPSPIRGEGTFSSPSPSTGEGRGEGDIVPGGIRVYLRHRARGYENAVGHTHFLRVDFAPDPATGNFLGRGVTITELYYRQMSKDPRVLYFPSETEQTFLYQRYEGDDNPQDGYLISRPHFVSHPLPHPGSASSPQALPSREREIDISPPSRGGDQGEGGDTKILSSIHLTFIFYDSTARDRRELQFVIQKGVGGKLNQIAKDTVRFFNLNSGEEMNVGAEGKLERVEEDGRTKFTLSRSPFKLVFWLDEEGRLPKGLEQSFFFRSLAKRQVVAMVERIGEVPEGVSARAKKLFEATWGYSFDQESPIPTKNASEASERGRLHPALPVEGATRAPIINPNLAGQKWKWSALAEGDTAELLGDEVEDELRKIWFAACLVCCKTRKVFDPPTSDDVRALTALADREPLRWDEIRARVQARVRDGETDQEAGDRQMAAVSDEAALHEEQLAPIREVVARLRASVNPEDRELVAIIEEVAHGTPLEDAIPGEWEKEKRDHVRERILALFTEWGSRLAGKTADPEELKRWFVEYVDGVGAGSPRPQKGEGTSPLREFSASPVYNTGLGLAIIEGLKTFVGINSPQPPLNVRGGEGELPAFDQTFVDSFTQNLMNAALAVYRDKNEIVAELLAEILVGVSLADRLEAENREDILARVVRDEIVRKTERLEAFHAFAVVAPYIREDLRDRVLRVLRRPNIGEAEKRLLDTLLETHFTDNPRHPVKVWKQNYGIHHWLAPLGTDKPPTSGSSSPPSPLRGEGQGEGGTKGVKLVGNSLPSTSPVRLVSTMNQEPVSDSVDGKGAGRKKPARHRGPLNPLVPLPASAGHALQHHVLIR